MPFLLLCRCQMEQALTEMCRVCPAELCSTRQHNPRGAEFSEREHIGAEFFYVIPFNKSKGKDESVQLECVDRGWTPGPSKATLSLPSAEQGRQNTMSIQVKLRTGDIPHQLLLPAKQTPLGEINLIYYTALLPRLSFIPNFSASPWNRGTGNWDWSQFIIHCHCFSILMGRTPSTLPLT